MFDRMKAANQFVELLSEIDRQHQRFQVERDEKEKIIKRTDAALSRCTEMIETLANALADNGGNAELVNDARICISILKGYTEPYTPSKTYPNVNSMKDIPGVKLWSNLVEEERKAKAKPKKRDTKK
jgi:inosine/xanthosine triphosphate pyrophosphatase family protein